VTVSNHNQEIVMVGCRIHVGNTSVSHIPSEVSLFHRAIKIDEGIKSWYDIPFTTAESLLADEEFTVTVGPAHDRISTSRLDYLEIYGRAKDDFGWKEKMDEVLNLEASAQTGAQSGKRPLANGASSTQEQVLADALKILARVYLLCGPHLSDVDLMEVRKLKCGGLLEVVFQSDCEPLLQFSACRVLQSIFPKKETYYQVCLCLFFLFFIFELAFLGILYLVFFLLKICMSRMSHLASMLLLLYLVMSL
jgi:E3 ubiquitin-protein ligase UBR4